MLSICYLFLGGAGAGALVILSASELAGACGADRLALPIEVRRIAWPICVVALGLGMLCLLADAGRPDRALALFTSPTFSTLSVGSFALMASFACAATFAAFALFDGVGFARSGTMALACAGVAAGVATAAYTGVLLQSLASVLFWQTPLLPATFLASSLSCGVACVLASAAFAAPRRSLAGSVRTLCALDGALLIVEAACLAVWIGWGLAGAGTRAAAAALASGAFAPAFWGGLVAGGLVAPWVLERMAPRGDDVARLVVIAALLLVGGFALRACVAASGAFDATQMPADLYGLVAG